jgi:hypothetical protein
MNRERDIDDLLRAWVSEGADHAPEHFVWAALDRIEATPQRGTWRRSLRRAAMRLSFAPLLLGTAAVLVATVGYLALSRPVDEGPAPSSSPTPSPTATSSASPSPSTTAEPSSPPEVSARPIVPSASIDIGGTPWQIRATDDSIWASVGQQLVRIDPATNEVTQRIDVPDAGSSCPECTGGDRGSWSFAIDGQEAWVAFHVDGASLVRRLDLEDGRIIADVPLEASGGEDVTVAFGAVWVSTCHSSRVFRIDPASNEVTDTVDVEEPTALGDCNAMYLGVGAGSVWTAFGGGGAAREPYVVRIDPESRAVSSTIHPRSGASCGQLAVADDDLWVSNCPGLQGQSIAHIDPAIDAEIGSVRFGGYPGEPVIDGNLVWVPVVGLSGGALTLAAIDRATGAIVDIVDPGTTVRTRGTSAASAVAGFDSLWVNGGDGTLLRFSRDDLTR